MSEPSNEASIFDTARKIQATADRDAFVRETCGEDSALRRRVEKLLSAYDAESQFLEQPAAALDATIVHEASERDRAESLQAGLAAAFHEGQSVVIGSAGHSVLKSLSHTIDNVPRVMLRDAVGDEPITKPSSPEVPDRVADSRYRLDGEIARGGMGAILKGRDTDLGRDLAIKVLLDAHKDNPEVIQRFVEEAQIGGQLQHPGIAPIYELGQFADKRPFFAMKLVKGQTLAKLLADRQDAADERGKFIGIFEQVCQTMAYAHSRGVIHRDLKPANIMVGAFGEVQVMDWGLAKVLPAGGVADEKKSIQKQQGQSIIQTMRSVGSDSPGTFGTLGSNTQMGSVMGTPAYMPPEQALGEIDQMDERADVFGLGAILCEILTGQPPYVAADGTQVFRMASRGKLEDALSRLVACGADEDLIALTRRCLELEPVDRLRDAGVLAERVTGYLESVEARLRDAEVECAAEAARADAEAAQAAAEHQRAEAESARAGEERKRRRTSLALAATVLLLVGLGSGGWLYMLRQEADRQAAEANAQRKHAYAMQKLAEERDEQRKVAETAQERATAEQIAAVAAKNAAETAEEEGRMLLYATDMQLVDALLKDEESSARQILSRLNAHDSDRPDNPKPGEDLRGFEWHYFKSLLEKRSTTFRGFDQPVVGSAINAEGELVTLDDDAQVRHFNAATRIETRASLDLKQGRQVGLKTLSPDGRMAALAVGDKVHLVDTTTGADLVPAIEAVTRLGVIFSPDAAMLITVDVTFAWWDTATGRQIAQLAVGALFARRRSNFSNEFLKSGVPVSVSADGLTVVVGPQGTSAEAWSAFRMHPGTASVTVLQDTFDRNGGTIDTLAITPDGRAVAIGRGSSGHLKFVDVVSGDLLGFNESEHASSLTTIGFKPQGYEMVTGSIDGVLKFWKDYRQLLSSEKRDDPETRALQGHDQPITQAVIAADGKRIISSSLDQTTRIWDLQQTASLAQSVTALAGHRAVFSPDGLLIVGADGSREIRVCEAATGRLVRSIPESDSHKQPLVVAMSPDNRLLAVARWKGVELWDLESGLRRIVLPSSTTLEVGDPRLQVASLAFSPNGEYLVAGIGWFDFLMNKAYEFDSPLVSVYDVATGRLIHDQRGHRNAVMSVAFSRNGKLLATASHDRTARIWDAETWQTIHVLNNPDESDGGTVDLSGVADVAFSSDGTLLAMASHAGNVHIFDTQSGTLVETFRGHAGVATSVSFSPSGRTLASGGMDNTVRLWNVATWRHLTTLNAGSTYLQPTSLRFSPNGLQLLAAGPESVVWSTRSEQLNESEALAKKLERLLESESTFENRIRLSSENLHLHEALELLDSDEPLVQAALAATRANWHASQERWAEAVAEFAALQKLDPDTSHGWLRSPGLLRVARALFEQNQPATASELIATASRQMQIDGITRSNLVGIEYVPNRFPIQLTVVATDSIAARVGLHAGDVISHVNEVELSADNAGHFDDLLAGEPGTSLRLTVRHAGGDEQQPIELIKELVYSDPQYGEQIATLRADVEQRLAGNADNLALRVLRAGLLGLLGEVQAQIADYTAVIDELSKRPQKEAAAELAELYRRRGDAYLDQKQWQLAVDDYAAVVTDKTTDEHLIANQVLALTNVLLPGEPRWTVLTPTPQGVKSKRGTTLTLLEDGSILASGNEPNQDTYEITANVPLRHLTAIRLEAIPHASLPQDGPGRNLTYGNFALNEFRLLINGTPHQPEGIVVSYAPDEMDPQIIDGEINETFYSTRLRMGRQHVAVFATDLELAADDTMTLELAFPWNRSLGRFRLSVSDDPNAYANVEKRFAARKFDDPRTGLAVIYALNGQNDRAVQYFGQALRQADSVAAKPAIFRQAALFDEVLEKLADLHPDELILQLALARNLAARGKAQLAGEKPDVALDTLKQAEEIFARLRSVGVNWKTLTPVEITSENGSKMDLQQDGSVFVHERAKNDTYTLVFPSELKGIVGLRLEAFADSRLPLGGPGWNENGNFLLSELTLQAVPAESTDRGRSIAFGSATADFNQVAGNWNIRNVLVDDNNTGWAVLPEINKNHTAVFELAQQLDDGPPSRFAVRLHFQHPSIKNHNLGRFRLSFTNDATTLQATRILLALKNSELIDCYLALGVSHARQEQKDAAITAIAGALSLAVDRSDKVRVIAEAALFEGLLEKLAERAADDGPLQTELARHFFEHGKTKQANAARARALSLFTEQLDNEPGNSVVAGELADLLLMDTTPWTVVKPIEMKAQGGEEFTFEEDGSLFVTGPNPDRAVYELKLKTNLPEVGAVRLETLPDARLASGGAGRNPPDSNGAAGSFVLSEFKAEAASADGTGQRRPIALSSAIAHYSKPSFPLRNAIDGNPKTYWDTYPKMNQRNWAVFGLNAPVQTMEGDLIITLDSGETRWKQHGLGRFRLSVSDNLTSLDQERSRVATMILPNPWVKLGVAYIINGDVEAAADLMVQSAADNDLSAWLESGVPLEGIVDVLHANQPDQYANILPGLASAAAEQGRLNVARSLYERLARLQPEKELWKERISQLQAGVFAVWNFDNGLGQWQQPRECQLSVKDGVLAVSRAGGDPHFQTPASGPAGGYTIVLRYRAQENFTLQLFWADTTGGFADSRHIDYPIPAAASQWREIPLPFACRGDLTSLRLDPNTREAHPLEIDSIVWRQIEPAEIETLSAEGALAVLAATSQSAEQMREAIPYLAKVSAANPQDTLLSLQVAAFQAWFGQKEELAATRQRILAAAKGTDKAMTAERAAKACSILPSTDETELKAVLVLGRAGVELNHDKSFGQWTQMALGMAEYRSGNCDAAEKALLAAEEAGPNNPSVTGTSAFYRAMSLFRQGKDDEARKLAIATALNMQPLPADEQILTDNQENLILWLAYKEAKALIQFDAPAPPQPEGERSLE